MKKKSRKIVRKKSKRKQRYVWGQDGRLYHTSKAQQEICENLWRNACRRGVIS